MRYEPNSFFFSLSSSIPLLPLIEGVPPVWMRPKSNKIRHRRNPGWQPTISLCT